MEKLSCALEQRFQLASQQAMEIGTTASKVKKSSSRYFRYTLMQLKQVFT